ncbi:hypothetical protein C3L33_16065, partial [Rhododendron williamsianum]
MGSAAGYCYSDDNPNSIQSHMDQFDSNPDQIYNLSTGLDISAIGIGGYPIQVPDQSAPLWHDQESPDRIGIDAHDHTRSLPFDASSLRCVFPCEGNERPSQGLSLSLSSANPSSIGLQSFELRHHQQQQNSDHEMIRFGTGSGSRSDHGSFGKSVAGDGYSGKPGNLHQLVQIRNSKYLGPAQDLLNEFCNLGLTAGQTGPKGKTIKPHHENTAASTSTAASASKNKSLYGGSNSSIEVLELQKRKSKLFSMLEEVRKCLRDGIVGQIKATKQAMGEKDVTVPGASRGETPRLRLLDQTLRQQRAVQQMSLMESHPWRPQRGLPERAVSVSNWFINARVRLWKPMVEEMYLEETKEQENNNMGLGASSSDDMINIRANPTRPEDQKPTPDQLVRIDSECLSSIINNPEKNDAKHMMSKSPQNPPLHHHHHLPQQLSFGRVGDAFGAIELDFSSYNHHRGGVSYHNDQNAHQNFGGGGSSGGGVSLTLGLQQHGGNGVSLAFSPSTSQSSLFYPRDHIEDCQPVQYSIMDGSEAQNLPYRNLMGAQLLHDLTG